MLKPEIRLAQVVSQFGGVHLKNQIVLCLNKKIKK
jgi:hypothetical protein